MDVSFLAVGYWSGSLGNKMEIEHELFLVRDITDVYDGHYCIGHPFCHHRADHSPFSALL